MAKKNEIVLFSLLKAIQSLQNAVEPPPANDRERDGAILRFEYTLELSWKVGQKILKDLGTIENSPKGGIRELGQKGFIEDVQKWLDFIDCRNETAHSYEEEVAIKIYTEVPLFLKAVQGLYRKFELYLQKKATP